ncbi:MAG: arginase family protein, partial [Planctomycetota bacterium]|nr:arginase family protein [Planctomycetota bacterium]
MIPKTVNILGVPMDLGQGRRGVDMGPSAVRYAGLENRLSLLGFEVIDSGNLTVPVPEETRDRSGNSGLEHLEAVSAINRNLADQVEDTLARGELAIILGGDHSLSAGSVAGAHRAGRVGVLWIDAHGDYNEPRTSPSGDLHGMPLASIAGREPIGLAPFTQEPVDPKDIALIGLRSIDPGERKNMIDDGVTA